jgi:hypothetical protein
MLVLSPPGEASHLSPVRSHAEAWEPAARDGEQGTHEGCEIRPDVRLHRGATPWWRPWVPVCRSKGRIWGHREASSGP